MKLKAVIVLLGSGLLFSTLQSHTKTNFQSLMEIALLQAQERAVSKTIEKNDPIYQAINRSLAQKKCSETCIKTSQSRPF